MGASVSCCKCECVVERMVRSAGGGYCNQQVYYGISLKQWVA